MKANKLYIVLLIMTGLWGACQSSVKDWQSYEAWHADPSHGYTAHRQVGPMLLKLRHMPVELMAYKELDTDRTYTRFEWDSLHDSYGHAQYFLYEVSWNPKAMKMAYDNTDLMAYGATDMSEYLNRLESFAFELGKDVCVLIDGDTLYPNLFHHERGYELGKRQRFLFAFPYKKSKPGKEYIFIHNDIHFNLGLQKFRLSPQYHSRPAAPLEFQKP